MKIKIEEQHKTVAVINNCYTIAREFGLRNDYPRIITKDIFDDFIHHIAKDGLDYDDECNGLKKEKVIEALEKANIDWSKEITFTAVVYGA